MSILGHVVVIGGLGLLAFRAPAVRRPERPVSVEILSQTQFEALRRPAAPPQEPAAEPSPPPPEEVDALSPPPSDDGLIQAERILSSAVLDDPRNAETRRTLFGLSADERMIQLCNAEALEQVRAWNAEFDPDYLVAYAMAELNFDKLRLRAEGGAIRSRHLWYEIRYTCDVAPELTEVTAFSFHVGDAIPREEWAEHYLTAGDTTE
ncbi:DUF930 domain-containing protein [Amorphus sp. 3PC139-8]|uniref:DUF930 domain-containing protein n=1 Tax=Amorphus sp. 3PC139-8 TaxID=2735676 RepID=UPI00345D8B8A